MFGFKEDKKEANADNKSANDAGGGAKEADAAGQKNEEEIPSGGKVSVMNSGDYMIHVLVQLHKNILLEGEDTCDPFIKIECMNVEKQTTVKNDITYSAKTIIDEHLFLEIKAADKEDLEKA